MKAHVDEVRESRKRKSRGLSIKWQLILTMKKKSIEQFRRDKERYRKQVLDATKTQGEAYLRVLESTRGRLTSKKGIR